MGRNVYQWAQRHLSAARRFWVFRSLSVGAVSTVCDVSILLLGVEALGLPRLPCVTAGVATGAVIGFTLNKSFTFKDSGHWGPQAFKYVALLLTEIGLHTGLTSVLLASRFHYLVAKFSADAAIFGVLHLFALRFLVFPVPKQSGYKAPHRADIEKEEASPLLEKVDPR